MGPFLKDRLVTRLDSNRPHHILWYIDYIDQARSYHVSNCLHQVLHWWRLRCARIFSKRDHLDFTTSISPGPNDFQCVHVNHGRINPGLSFSGGHPRRVIKWILSNRHTIIPPRIVNWVEVDCSGAEPGDCNQRVACLGLCQFGWCHLRRRANPATSRAKNAFGWARWQEHEVNAFSNFTCL